MTSKSNSTEESKFPVTPIDEIAYQKEMDIIHDSLEDDFFQIYYDYTKYLKGYDPAVLVLGHILSQLRSKNYQAKEKCMLIQNDMWFESMAKNIQEELGISRHKQQRAFAVLLEKNIIQTRHSIGNVLWIRINTKELRRVHKLHLNERQPKSRNGPSSHYSKSG